MATESDKINTAALGTLVTVGALATLAVALGVDALVRHETTMMEEQRAGMALKAYEQIAAEQQGKLTGSPTWVDKSKGIVSVPIDKAVSGVLSDLARDPASATEPGQPDAAAPAPAHDGFGTPGAGPAGSATTPQSGAPASSAAPVPAGSVTLPQTPSSATPPVPTGSGASAAPKAPKGPRPMPAAPVPTSPH
jgi:hypothetical protein